MLTTAQLLTRKLDDDRVFVGPHLSIGACPGDDSLWAVIDWRKPGGKERVYDDRAGAIGGFLARCTSADREALDNLLWDMLFPVGETLDLQPSHGAKNWRRPMPGRRAGVLARLTLWGRVYPNANSWERYQAGPQSMRRLG